MTNTTKDVAWSANVPIFDFSLPDNTHIQRGWERAPQSSHAARLKGRKVWKRPDLASRDSKAPVQIRRSALAEVSNNTPRAVKKLRLKDNVIGQKEPMHCPQPRSFATLRDGVAGTPKRKLVQPHNLAIQVFTEEDVLDSLGVAFPPEAVALETQSDIPCQGEETSNEDAGSKTESMPLMTESDDATAQSSIALIEEDSPQPEVDNDRPEGPEGVNATPNDEARPDSNLGEVVEERIDTPKRSELATTTTSVGCGIVANVCATPSSVATSPRKRKRQQTSKQPDASPDKSKSAPHMARSALNTSVANPSPNSAVCDSPQIGTTLLRRESLRKKESPLLRRSRPSRSPQKKQLKKRDTLQEREILQNFGTQPCDKAIVDPEEDDVQPKLDAVVQPGLDQVTARAEISSDRSHPVNESPSKAEVLVERHVPLENHQGIEPHLELMRSPSKLNEEFSEIIDAASVGPLRDESNPEEVQVEDAAEGQDTQRYHEQDGSKKSQSPARKTRSGARFSDDTSMLKAFLDRAQAKKAANHSLDNSSSFRESPRKSPRKMQAQRYGALHPSPSKSRDCKKKAELQSSLSPPTRRQHPDALEVPETDQDGEDIAACRRSGRTRLPAPTKTPPGAPSLIPVRRADGGDPVVLQKSEAQELAITTRANTRRNKGQAKPPLLALQALSSSAANASNSIGEEEPMTRTRGQTRNAKAVAWAEQLASYHGNATAPDVNDSTRAPPVRRVRALGAVNGTPAKKKAASSSLGPSNIAVPPASSALPVTHAAPNGTPAPRRRAKIR